MLFIRKEIITAFKKCIFPYIDEFQVKKDTDEKIDTTNMPKLESEESAKQRKNRQGKGF